MNPDPLATDRRTILARKGRRLYGKFCGTGGRGICAESFAVYHISNGELDAVRDLLCYLEAQVQQLKKSDPDNRLAMTIGLKERIQLHLQDSGQSTRDCQPLESREV